MPTQDVFFMKGDKVDNRVDFRDFLPVNVYAVPKQIFGAPGYLYQEPGIESFGTGVGIDRGGVWNERQSVHFRVSGTKLISVSSTGVVTELGDVPGTDLVSLPYSFETQAIIANGKYFLYDSVNGFREVTDVDLGNPIDAVWVDGYYFFTDGEFLYHTEINDESGIDPIQYETSQFSPDPTIGVSLTTDNKVIAWNRYTTEYFANQPSDDPVFAFTRIPSRNVKYGIVGTHCKAEIAGNFFFLGSSKESNISVYQLGVGDAQNISTREVDRVIGQYTESQLAEAKLETRVIDNYPFLLVRLPNETLSLNIKALQSFGVEFAWSILRSGTDENDPYRAINGVFDERIAKWVYGDLFGTNIGTLNDTIATHYGDQVECVMSTPFILLEAISVDRLEIQTIPGFNTTQANVFFSLTYDGVFYSNEEILSYSAPGDYGARFIVRALGYIREFFSIKIRWVSESRMCFARAQILYG